MKKNIIRDLTISFLLLEIYSVLSKSNYCTIKKAVPVGRMMRATSRDGAVRSPLKPNIL